MKKRLFMFATAALMLAACSNDGEVAVNDGAAQLQSGSGVVGFDIYTSSATKAGGAGIQTTSTLQEAAKGFGVFAQYSNDGGYSKAVNPSNFMWNQHVHYSAGAWTYTPLKYWPNETTDDPQATGISAATDMLSFFAYAPYVAEQTDKYSGVLDGIIYAAGPEISDSHVGYPTMDKGITSIIANNVTGNDPWVRYTVASKPSESVDLLWGVAPSGGLKYTAVNGSDIEVEQGMPLVNLVKPAKDQKIKFLFQHALARIGMTIVAAVDQIAAGGNLDAATKIAVESVNITETTSAGKKLKTSGALNLKNTSPFISLWSYTDGDIDFTVSNAAEGELNPDIAYDTDAATTWNKPSTLTTWTGVTTAEKKVIAQKSDKDQYFMVIPGNAYTKLQVVITYYVITKDVKLNGQYSEVKNVITKEVAIPKLTNNKAYNLKLILGLTSVKLEAEVADWQVDGSNEVYLPQNAE